MHATHRKRSSASCISSRNKHLSMRGDTAPRPRRSDWNCEIHALRHVPDLRIRKRFQLSCLWLIVKITVPRKISHSDKEHGFKGGHKFPWFLLWWNFHGRNSSTSAKQKEKKDTQKKPKQKIEYSWTQRKNKIICNQMYLVDADNLYTPFQRPLVQLPSFFASPDLAATV